MYVIKIVINTTPATAAFQRETKTIPIVFTVVSDPVGAGFVESLPRPGGNITGFIQTEAAMGGKLLELLKEAAPQVQRAALIFNPDRAARQCSVEPAVGACGALLPRLCRTRHESGDGDDVDGFHLLRPGWPISGMP